MGWRQGTPWQMFRSGSSREGCKDSEGPGGWEGQRTEPRPEPEPGFLAHHSPEKSPAPVWALIPSSVKEQVGTDLSEESSRCPEQLLVGSRPPRRGPWREQALCSSGWALVPFSIPPQLGGPELCKGSRDSGGNAVLPCTPTATQGPGILAAGAQAVLTS